MFNFRKLWGSRKAQSVLEYGVLLAIVAAAFLSMAVYIRRAVQGSIYRMDDRVTGKSLRGEEARWHSYPP